jgi:hypothetical protein
VTAPSIVGTWRLVAWENRTAGGRVTYPFGQDAVGYLMYSADGHMCATVMRAGRPRFAAGDLLAGERAERLAAVASYATYGGRYTYLGDRVIHHVEVSLFPNWVGTDQERLVDLVGARLTLSTRPLLMSGEPQTGHLVWERVPSSG